MKWFNRFTVFLLSLASFFIHAYMPSRRKIWIAANPTPQEPMTHVMKKRDLIQWSTMWLSLWDALTNYILKKSFNCFLMFVFICRDLAGGNGWGTIGLFHGLMFGTSHHNPVPITACVVAYSYSTLQFLSQSNTIYSIRPQILNCVLM